jgi:hypothetical protein
MRKLLATWATLGAAAASGCKHEAAAPRVMDLQAPPSIAQAPALSGDSQVATVGTTLPQPLRVLVTRASVPAPGVTVHWTAQQDTFGHPGSLSASGTTTDASGIASVSWTLGSVAGQKWVSASIDGSPDTLIFTTNLYVGFTAVATPGPARQLRFWTGPTNVYAGQLFSPPVQVAALDAFDNPAAFSGRTTIALGGRPGTGTLSGTITVDAVAGLATFGDLRIDQAGTGYTLDASANGLASATSAAFIVRLPPNSVSVGPTLAGVDLGTSLPFTATVANDPSNAGVSWRLTGTGCSGSACGALSNTVSASGVPISYTAPAVQPVTPIVFLTAAAITDSTAVAPATIVVTTPGQVSVYVTPATAGLVVNGSVPLTATVFNDPAQAGVTWTLSCTNTTGACGTVAATSSASGVAVSYRAPSSATTVTVTAASITDPTRSAVATVTVRPPCCRGPR